MSLPFDTESRTEALRRAWAAADDRDAGPGTGPGAAEDERVWRAVAGELPAEELGALVEAAARDPELARSWRLARELHASAAAATGGRRLGFFPGLPVAARRVAAAAAVVLLGVGLAFWLRSGEVAVGPDGPAWRGETGPVIAPRTPEGARLSRREFVVRWTALPEPETRYSLRVTTAELALVAEARELTAAEYRVEPAALAGRPPGSRFYWQVDARLPGGRIVSSPAFAVVLDD